MVSYLMILMNYYTATDMIQFQTGIYRSVIYDKNTTNTHSLPENVNNFLKIWNSSCGQYDLFDGKKAHEMLELDSYIHCTSPIRRLVDILNMATLQEKIRLYKYSDKFHEFYKNWTGKMDYINTTMRAIRKIQNECNLLDMCINDPTLCDKTYDGYVFDRIIRNDGLYQYVVYLVDLKTVFRITLRYELEDYNKYSFKIFIFNDEDSLKKKLRLHIVDN